MAKRGRPCRAGVRADRRMEFMATRTEEAAIKKLAAANRMSVADWMRLQALGDFDDPDPDARPVVMMGGRVMKRGVWVVRRSVHCACGRELSDFLPLLNPARPENAN